MRARRGNIEWRAEQHVSDKYSRAHAHGRLTHSNCFLSSMATPPRSLAIVHSIPAIPPHDPRASSERPEE